MIAKRLLFPEIRQVTWESFDIPSPPDPHSIVVETRCSLISVGTELAIYTGRHIGFSLPNPPFPMMPNRPGYALVGRVTAIGEDVGQHVGATPGFQVGQRVMMQVPHGTMGVVDVRHGAVVPLPDAISDTEGALIRMAEVALTAVRVAPVQLGDAVVVYGLGLVGQFVAQLFRLNGAHPVIAIDRLPARIEVARANGIIALNADEVDIPAAVANLTGGRGPDVVVEATGSPAVLALSLNLVGEGGRVVLLGSTRGRIEIDPYSHIHRKGIRLIGAHERVQTLDIVPHRWNQTRNLHLLADLFATGNLRSHGLITHTIAPNDALPIYDKLADQPQDYLGVVIDWGMISK